VNTGEALDLSPGTRLVLDEAEWLVERHEPHFGRVALVGDDGTRQWVSFRFLINHPACRVSSFTAAAGADRGRQPAVLEDLAPDKLKLARLRMAHLLEVATGFRGGDPMRPAEGEPKPCYDPKTTTLTQRRHAKVAELAALDREEARLLGLDKVGYRTLIRWENARQGSVQ
jgi:hypothetical protein